MHSRLVAGLLLITGAAGTLANTSIPLTRVAGDNWAGSFSGAAASNVFDLNLSSFSSFASRNVTVLLTANSIFGQGFDITGASFDSTSFTAKVNTTVPNVISVDYWFFGPVDVSASLHTLTVEGISGGTGAFTGSVSLSLTAIPPPPVPEPETYALMLAGLGVIGFLARRRRGN